MGSRCFPLRPLGELRPSRELLTFLLFVLGTEGALKRFLQHITLMGVVVVLASVDDPNVRAHVVPKVSRCGVRMQTWATCLVPGIALASTEGGR